ncbi:hypothetical protein IPM09_04380 [Candidatus Saccharibacteria bacterium]|nr:MAG: hypothetical protein IPM09_04380 [Candidatus Saccharibacteria bacterium]
MQFALLVPLIFVNLWHGLVIAIARKRGKVWRSISESALAGKDTLVLHRTMHVIGAVCFYIFALWMWPSTQLRWSAGILAVAATFDIAQAFALSIKTLHAPISLKDAHQVTAWIMAGAYLLFSVVFMQNAGVPNLLVICYLVWLFIVYAWSSLMRHKHFWLTQMIFFVSVEVVVLIAAIKLYF